jgi:hypothetical protein
MARGAFRNVQSGSGDASGEGWNPNIFVT